MLQALFSLQHFFCKEVLSTLEKQSTAHTV